MAGSDRPVAPLRRADVALPPTLACILTYRLRASRHVKGGAGHFGLQPVIPATTGSRIPVIHMVQSTIDP
jgi:hypothetical protein